MTLRTLLVALAAATLMMGTTGCESQAQKSAREVKRFVAQGKLNTAYRESARILREAEENPGDWDEATLRQVREIHERARRILTNHYEDRIASSIAEGNAQEVANLYGAVLADTPELLVENPTLQRRMMRFYGAYGVLDEAQAFARRVQELPKATEEDRRDAELFLQTLEQLEQARATVDELKEAASQAILRATGGEVFAPELVMSCGIDTASRLSPEEQQALERYQMALAEYEGLQATLRDLHNPTLSLPVWMQEQEEPLDTSGVF